MVIEYFEQKLPKSLYRKLNKDKSLNYRFRADNVGKCVSLFDEYVRSCDEISRAGWHLYYFKNVNLQNLTEAAEYAAQKYSLSMIDAKEYVYYRVVGQTWNGMMEEYNVIRKLENLYKNFEWRKSPYHIDEQYFTDWEAYHNNKLMIGIQIKPVSYKKMNSAYQTIAKSNHQEQRKKYKEEFGVPHFIVYYDNHEIVELQNLVNTIDTYLAYSITIR